MYDKKRDIERYKWSWDCHRSKANIPTRAVLVLFLIYYFLFIMETAFDYFPIQHQTFHLKRSSGLPSDNKLFNLYYNQKDQHRGRAIQTIIANGSAPTERHSKGKELTCL